MSVQYDVLVIGAGPGGYVASIRAAQLGLKVGCIEKENLGGICLNWGCIPTKALLKSAEVYDYVNHAQEYGVTAEKPVANFEAMIKRSRQVADKMNNGIKFLFKKNKVDAIMGTAKLIGNGQVEVQGHDGKKSVYSAKHIILATGARARSLPAMPIDGKTIIGYREAMTLPTLPKSMIVVGSGAIGTEFAFFYSTIGTKVTLVEYLENIVPVEDHEVSQQLARSFKAKGIDVLTSTEVTKVEKIANGVRATLKSKEGEKTIDADILLSAVGIVTNVEGLGLESVGVKVEKGKVIVDSFYKTSVPGIYAIGDITSGPALAHVASAEGIICVENIAGHHPQPLDYGNIPGCTYCQPEIASVGLTEKAAKEAGYQLKIGKFPFSASGKATAAGKNEGFVKIIYDAKYGELLGTHMIGSNVTEMIAEIVVARKLETTGYEILKAVHPHPTLSEAIMEATAHAFGEVIHI
ncbi:MAG: dihydrolipoyl dehydrogenase [Bacteroidia bacterium]|nr:dihydrolipoyl dehydrogenase [Bacteroidia bacterium]